MPNWRGFQGFGSPAEVGRFCDCGLTAANRPTGCRSRKLARLSHPPRGMDIAGASPESFHSMKVEKLFPRWRAPFEGPRLLALAETCGGGRNRARPERARQFERLAERQLPLWLSPSRGVWNPYEAPVSIGSRAIQPHLTDHGTGIHVSSKPSKTRGSVRFSRTALFSSGSGTPASTRFRWRENQYAGIFLHLSLRPDGRFCL